MWKETAGARTCHWARVKAACPDDGLLVISYPKDLNLKWFDLLRG